MNNNLADSDTSKRQTDRIEIQYFTDPLCCWSWAFESHWRKFINENKHLISWRYRMGGMISDWKSYSDPLNDITRPAQMAPLWLQVKYTTQTEINPDIWIEDAPQSSLPACMAVKCAEIQSGAAADALLFTLRKAVMTEKKNIARKEIILEIAKALSSKYPVLDYPRFEADFSQNKAALLLKADLQICRNAEIGRFPSITIQKPGHTKGIIIMGYRPYSVLDEAFKSFSNALAKQQ